MLAGAGFGEILCLLVRALGRSFACWCGLWGDPVLADAGFGVILCLLVRAFGRSCACWCGLWGDPVLGFTAILPAFAKLRISRNFNFSAKKVRHGHVFSLQFSQRPMEIY